jgi:hypothetical protein
MRFVGVLCLFLSVPSLALAADDAPAPGTCRYRKTPTGETTSVKTCATAGSSREFHIGVAQGVPVLIKIAPDSLVTSVPPDENLASFGAEENGLLVFEPKVPRFTRPVVVQLVTQGGLDVTLHFEMKANPDTQVHIVRPDQEERDRVCDQRVNGFKAELEASYAKKEAALTSLARKQGRQWILRQMIEHTDAGSVNERALHDFLRLRVNQRISLSGVLLLRFEVDERKGDPALLATPVAVLAGSGGTRKLLTEVMCDHLELAAADTAQCALAIKIPAHVRSDDRITLTVSERRGARSVSLTDLELR